MPFPVPSDRAMPGCRDNLGAGVYIVCPLFIKDERSLRPVSLDFFNFAAVTTKGTITARNLHVYRTSELLEPGLSSPKVNYF